MSSTSTQFVPKTQAELNSVAAIIISKTRVSIEAIHLSREQKKSINKWLYGAVAMYFEVGEQAGLEFFIKNINESMPKIQASVN